MLETIREMGIELLGGGRLALDCLWQPALVLLAGWALSHLAGRPSRAHYSLLLALVASIFIAPASYFARSNNLGLQRTTQARPEVPSQLPEHPNTSQLPMATRAVPDSGSVITPPKASSPAPLQSGKFTAVRPNATPAWPAVLARFSLAISALLALRIVFALRTGSRMIAQAKPALDDRLVSAVTAAARDLQLPFIPELLICRQVHNPMIWLWRRRPALLLPVEAMQVEANLDWTALMRHELAHWKRGDHRAGLLAELVVCAFPWNPLAWLARRRLGRLAELACDDWAVRGREKAESYAESLLAFVSRREVLLLGQGMAVSRSTLAARVRRLLSQVLAEPRRGTGWTAGAVVLALGAGLLLACWQGRIDFSQIHDHGPLVALYQEQARTDLSAIRARLKDAAHYLSAAQAVTAARPGDVVYLPAGVYKGGFLLKSGVTVVGEDREKTILDLFNPILGEGVHDAHIHNLTLQQNKNFGTGLVVKNSRGILISNCKITAPGRTQFERIQSGAFLESTQARFEHSIIEKSNGCGVESNKGCDLEIRQCLFRDIRQAGVFIGEDDHVRAIGNWFSPGSQSALFNTYPGSIDADIIGNTIIGQTGSGIAFRSRKIIVRNNTIIGCHFGGIALTRDTHGSIEDNIFVGNSEWEAIILGSPSPVQIRHNLFWKNGHKGGLLPTSREAIKADPRFVDLAAGDFRLTSGSRAIGKGEVIGAWGAEGADPAASWIEPANQPALAPGGRILVVDTGAKADEFKLSHPLMTALDLARELSDNRANEAGEKRILGELEKIRPELKCGPNLVANPNFERGSAGQPEGWTLCGGKYTELKWGEGLGWQGSRGVYLKKTSWKKAAGDPIFASFEQSFAAPRDNAVVEASLKIKTRAVGKTVFDLAFLDQNGQWLSHIWLAPFGDHCGNANQDWQEVVRYAWVPPTTKTMVISVQMYMPGEVWIDDVNCAVLEAK